VAKSKIENCHSCGKENLSFNEVGLCKKLLGRQIERFMCLDCLAEYLKSQRRSCSRKSRNSRRKGALYLNSEEVKRL